MISKRTELLTGIAQKFTESDSVQKIAITNYILGWENGKEELIRQLREFGITVPAQFINGNTPASP